MARKMANGFEINAPPKTRKSLHPQGKGTETRLDPSSDGSTVEKINHNRKDDSCCAAAAWCHGGVINVGKFTLLLVFVAVVEKSVQTKKTALMIYTHTDTLTRWLKTRIECLYTNNVY